MAIQSISPKAVCSHYHFMRPFCPRQTSSQKISTVFFYALGVAIVGWISYQACRAATHSAATPPGPPGPRGAHSSPLTASPPIKVVASLTLPLVPTHPSKSNNSKMADLIHSEKDIIRLPEIAGVSLNIIQQRAEAKAQDNLGETARGFIQKNDRILNLIREDWQTAQAAHVTHIEIADHLHNITEAAKKQPGKPVSYDWTTKSFDANKDTPRFMVIFQKSNDEMMETDIFRPKGIDRQQGSSKEEALILNPAVQGPCIRWTAAREDYIRKYGFYATGTRLEDVLGILKGKPLVIPE